MQIGIPAEIRGGETRVAATPETVKKFTAKGFHTVLVQSGAGAGASIPDEAYQAAGATIVAKRGGVYTVNLKSCLKYAVRNPAELEMMRKDAVLLGLLAPHRSEGIEALARHGLTAFAMEKLPRISRAQSMDVLSSQANIAGYKAVLMAANVYQKFFPDADDRRGHCQGGTGTGSRRGRSRLAGYRHGKTAGCGDRGLRCSSRGKGTGGKPGRQICRGSAQRRRKSAGGDSGRLRPGDVG